VKTSGSAQSSDYYETKTKVARKTYRASVDSIVKNQSEHTQVVINTKCDKTRLTSDNKLKQSERKEQ